MLNFVLLQLEPRSPSGAETIAAAAVELAADSPTPGSQPSAPVTPAALDAVPAPAALDDVAVDDLEKELELDLENMQLDENIDTSVRTGRNRPEPD